MQNTPLVSIIMPAYNGEKTIRRAIESVLQQTYSSIELIVVNDGSKDKTIDVIHTFNDSRLVVISQDNAGLSTARNAGMSRSRGDYLTFIDCDDWYENDYIEKLVSANSNNASQLSVCGMFFHKPKQTVPSVVYDVKYSSFFDNADFLSKLETGIMNSVCNKIYKIDIIKKNNLYFRNISIVEDLEFNLRYLQYVKCLSFIPYNLYHYDNTSSVLTKKVSTDMFDNYIHLHAWLFSVVPIAYFDIISRFIFHQYLSFFIRYSNLVLAKQKRLKDVKPIFDFYISNPLINHSFSNYIPHIMGEKILVGLLWHRYYKLFVYYLYLLRLLNK